ncbi:MAG: hypothetical protein ACKVQW_11120 [Pyrinomonadaceae bacterium]
MSKDEILATLEEDNPKFVSIAVLSAVLNSGDGQWAEEVCYRLAKHQDENVRGNAMQGLGHIARVHGKLDGGRALAILEFGLKDPHEYVRGNAEDALDDLRQYLHLD